MFALVRHLQGVRRQQALARPPGSRSLAVRHVDSGSCNACEHELNATAAPQYDLQRFGLDFVASPRHADVLLVTGAPTRAMEPALLAAYAAMPEPRRVVALGDCALGCGLLGDPRALAPPLERLLPVDVRIPGCPPPPERIAAGILSLLGESATG